MTAYLAIPNSDIDPESPINTSLMTALRDNPIAMFEKAPGAPVLADGYVVQAMIAAGAVGQGQLKTAIATASTTSTTGQYVTMNGGAYAFRYQIRINNTSGNTAEKYAGVGGTAPESPAPTMLSRLVYTLALGAASPWETNFYISADALSGNNPGTTEIRETFIQASPPYDLGDGEIPLFVFVVVDSLGNIESMTVAPEAPWHYNGPTDIRADTYRNGKAYRRVRSVVAEAGSNMQTIESMLKDGAKRPEIMHRLRNDPMVDMEITQAIKNADMPLIPHPFRHNDLTGKTVVMLDPVCDCMWELAEIHKHGGSVDDLLRSGAIRFDNTALNRAGPQGVPIVAPRWK